MKWNEFINEIAFINKTEVKKYLDSTKMEAYQLLDVRQPEEYNEFHLPGAILMPLSELVEGLDTLDTSRATLVYCTNGVRSIPAARFLNSNGFSDVQIMEGGINAWEGGKAFGHVDLNLNLLSPDSEFSDAFTLAFAMEEGMQQFYTELAKETKDPLFKNLYRELASFETKHKQELSRQYPDLVPQALKQSKKRKNDGQIMEGGGQINEDHIKIMAKQDHIARIFELAIALETQALDFYFRLSQRAEDADVKRFFLEMADSEKKHLGFVSKEMNIYLEKQRGGI